MSNYIVTSFIYVIWSVSAANEQVLECLELELIMFNTFALLDTFDL